MKARDIMTAPVVTLLPSDSLEKAASLMVKHNIGCLPVVDEQGRLKGVITQSDFEAHVGFAPFSLFEMPKLFGRMLDVEGMERIFEDVRQLSVAKLMTGAPRTASPDATVEAIAGQMLEKPCHHIPIVSEGKVVGMVARRDLLKILASPSGPSGRR